MIEVLGIDDRPNPAASLFPHAPPELVPGERASYTGRGFERLKLTIGKCQEIENHGDFGLSILASQSDPLMTRSARSYIYCRFRSYVSLFRVWCHRSVTIPDFMSPAFGRVVVGPVAWAHRQVVVCASRMGNALRDIIR